VHSLFSLIYILIIVLYRFSQLLRVLENRVTQCLSRRWLQRIYYLSHALYPSRSVLPKFPELKIATLAFLIYCFPQECLYNPEGDNDQRLIAATQPLIECIEDIFTAVAQPDYKGFNTLDPHVVGKVTECILSFVEHFQTWQEIDVKHLIVHIHSALHVFEQHAGNLDREMPSYETVQRDLSEKITKLKQRLAFLDGTDWEQHYKNYLQSPRPSSLADTRQIKPQILMFYNNIQLVHELMLDSEFTLKYEMSVKFFDRQDRSAVYSDEFEFFRQISIKELNSMRELQHLPGNKIFTNMALILKDLHSLLTQRTRSPPDTVAMANHHLDATSIDQVLLDETLSWDLFSDFVFEKFRFLICVVCQMPKPTTLGKQQLHDTCTALLINQINALLFKLWTGKVENRPQVVFEIFYLFRYICKTLSLAYTNENIQNIKHRVVRGCSQYCREAFEKKVAQSTPPDLATHNVSRHLRRVKFNFADQYTGTFESISAEFYVSLVIQNDPWDRLTMLETLASLGPRLEILRKQVHLVAVFCSLSTVLHREDSIPEDWSLGFEVMVVHFEKISTIQSLCTHLEFKLSQRGRWELFSDSIKTIVTLYNDAPNYLHNPLHVTW
jgi:hypothetical protein